MGMLRAQRPVTWSDAWFHTFWRFMGPRTDKYFADCKAKLFSSAPLAGGSQISIIFLYV